MAVTQVTSYLRGSGLRRKIDFSQPAELKSFLNACFCSLTNHVKWLTFYYGYKRDNRLNLRLYLLEKSMAPVFELSDIDDSISCKPFNLRP